MQSVSVIFIHDKRSTQHCAHTQTSVSSSVCTLALFPILSSSLSTFIHSRSIQQCCDCAPPPFCLLYHVHCSHEIYTHQPVRYFSKIVNQLKCSIHQDDTSNGSCVVVIVVGCCCSFVSLSCTW